MKSVFCSPLPPIDIPQDARNIAGFFFDRMHQLPEFTRSDSPRPLYIAGSPSAESLTLAQFEELVRSLASGLYHKAGVRPNDTVAVVLPNTIHYPAIMLAVLLAGATCTPANPAYTARELAHQLHDAGARTVITSQALLPLVKDALALCDSADATVLLDDRDHPQSMFGILCDRPLPAECSDAPADAPALVPYSSGTTGLPKGVVLSHRNIIANALQVLAVQQPGQPSMPRTAIAVLPMFHSFGLLFLCVLMPISRTTTVVMPKFDLHGFLRLVDTYRVTDAMLVPPIINALAKTPGIAERYNLASLAEVIVGAAPLSASTIEAVESRLPHLLVLQGFGLTEASPAVSLNPPAGRRPLSVGRLLPSIDAIVLDALGRRLGPNETGELCFRGPNIMLGYLNNADETARCIDSDGFFHTGDIGYIDDDCFIYITDRKKELIKYNGFQVAPAELEGILMQHENVKDCAVVGVFDEERQTEVPRAFLVLAGADDADAAASEVVRWLDAQVAYYKRLRGGYRLVDAVPKSASGKLLRRMLKEMD
ncbi:hypothetical protein GGI15_002559 [Coemansia interrupta]|uniref:4-coumarate--CoA ligase n=1 Tax=Coemansia interrupta TaxID=1126814 RepID=A0A9W8LIU7_9FUNG|nr:hypothetical protein GGI15_002559 [Coemansia interrupta]